MRCGGLIFFNVPFKKWDLLGNLMISIKEMLKKKSGKTIFQGGYGHASFSQHGEDIVVYKLLESMFGSLEVYNGFFVDLGAHHPFHYSNTMLLHLCGWKGLNVDAKYASKLILTEHLNGPSGPYEHILSDRSGQMTARQVTDEN